jgi:His-Xaa-Ser system protein HxsD
MKEYHLLKSSYTEWVVRNSLYWISSMSAWSLEDDETRWTVHFKVYSEDVAQEFSRLLNDYCLREKLNNKTVVHRDAIAKNVLSSIHNRLNK